MEDYPSPNTIRILITTDNHVGYNENDPIVGDDSWKSFHEAMMIAKERNVDMVLQGGDLFHVNKPSKKSMYQVMRSLRLACMGDRPCELELLSDPSKVFHYNEFTNVNYEDPNFNISIPFFSISGNHDDVSGDGLLCPMDILQVSGLVNHFGKVMQSDDIEVTPLLFQKGNTKLALYGLASVRDERLFRTFKDGHVKFNVPTMREGEWFNLMCVHQNHTGHANTAFLPETFLPNFLDLVVWGHEHECVPHLIHNPIKNFDVLQPGSSIATSLCEAEAKPKQVFILEIQYGLPPKLIPVFLETVRPFIMKDISLQNFAGLKPHDKENISKRLVEEVESMIEEANSESKVKLGNEYDEADPDSPELPLPLIRLRVDYSASPGVNNIDFQVENPRRFSNRFVGRVANTNNIVQFYKKKKASTSKKAKGDDNLDLENLLQQNGGELGVQTLVDDLLNKMQLSLLPELGMNEAVKKFIDKDDKNALKEFIDNEIDHEVLLLAANKEFLKTDDVNDLKKLVKQVKSANSHRSTSGTPSEQELKIETATSKDPDVVMSDSENYSNIPSFTTHSTKPSRGRNLKKKQFNADVIASSEDDKYASLGVDVEVEEKEENGNDGDYNNNINDPSLIESDVSIEEVRPKLVPQNTRKRVTTKKNTATKRKTKTIGSKTPKTDILGSLLAKKRG